VSIEDETAKATGISIPEPVAALGSETELRELESLFYNPDLDFRKLALDSAYRAQGFTLIDKEALENVPFVVKRVVYRPGFPRGENKEPGDYISAECVVADREFLSLPQVKYKLPTELKVYPNQPVVFNDSGTGIRRKLTEAFATASIVIPGKNRENENPFDQPFQRWIGGADVAQSGIDGTMLGAQGVYFSQGGLRRSDYESPYGPATTWYFA
jgi:hypothetical protein